MRKILIGTATLNEALNIDRLLSEIVEQMPHADILVVDDGSQDGSQSIFDRWSASCPRFRLLQRGKKLGLGTAHVAMMRFAIENNYDYLITMDADFSHRTEYLPRFIELLEKKKQDFVIGSRYTHGGHCDYGFLRQFLSRMANNLTRFLLDIPIKECTTSYRGIRVELLRQLPLEQLNGRGYSFFFEFVYVVSRATKKMAEFPIYFPDRIFGSSKLNRKEVVLAMYYLFGLFRRHMV